MARASMGEPVGSPRAYRGNGWIRPERKYRLAVEQGWTCGLCQGAIQPLYPCGHFDVDHILPVAQGGTNEDNNLRVAHPHCNRGRRP